MYAVIAGAGTVGTYIALSLRAEGHTVALIDKSGAHLNGVTQNTAPSVERIEGDATEPSVLERAGVRQADLVLAATGLDEDNLVVCFLAKHRYGVARTVARVNHPNNTWMFAQDMGVDVAISQAHIISHLIQAEIEVGQLIPLLALQEGEVALVEETIAPTARAVGYTIGRLELPAGAVAVALIRRGRVLVPTSDLTVESGDRLIALARGDQQEAVSRALR
jgi:trk system potassium uptake protein TrkA